MSSQNEFIFHRKPHQWKTLSKFISLASFSSVWCREQEEDTFYVTQHTFNLYLVAYFAGSFAHLLTLFPAM